MIISRTPFRVSFLGGGTDLPEFYREEEGAVISTTITKYMYVTINDRFDETYRLSYSRTEIARSLSDIEHPIFRTVLARYAKGEKGLEIISMADIPGGTGLGSSSSFTVGLLHALKTHLGLFQSAEALAAEASEIEIEQLKEPIGKQDQYAAAFGGLQLIRFLPDGTVKTDPLICGVPLREALGNAMMLMYTGQTRAAADILTEQRAGTEGHRSVLREMRDLAFELKSVLQGGKAGSPNSEPEPRAALEEMGRLLHVGWGLKKGLARGISSSAIDDAYTLGKAHGAWGGKILGAGGGGFLLLLAPVERQAEIERALNGLRRIPIGLEPWGSRIIFVG